MDHADWDYYAVKLALGLIKPLEPRTTMPRGPISDLQKKYVGVEHPDEPCPIWVFCGPHRQGAERQGAEARSNESRPKRRRTQSSSYRPEGIRGER